MSLSSLLPPWGRGLQPSSLNCSPPKLFENLRPPEIKLNIPFPWKHASVPLSSGPVPPPAPLGPAVPGHQLGEAVKFQDRVCDSLQMKCQKYGKGGVINLILI